MKVFGYKYERYSYFGASQFEWLKLEKEGKENYYS